MFNLCFPPPSLPCCCSPNYSPYGQTTGNPSSAQNYKLRIPLQPIMSSAKQYASIHLDAQGTTNPNGGLKVRQQQQQQQPTVIAS